MRYAFAVALQPQLAAAATQVRDQVNLLTCSRALLR